MQFAERPLNGSNGMADVSQLIAKRRHIGLSIVDSCGRPWLCGCMVIYGSQGRSLRAYGLLMLEERSLREVGDNALIRLKHTTGDCSADNSQHCNYGLQRRTSACTRVVNLLNIIVVFDCSFVSAVHGFATTWPLPGLSPNYLSVISTSVIFGRGNEPEV